MKQLMRLVAVLTAAWGLLWLSTASQAQQPLKIGFSMSLSGGLASGGKSAILAYEIWKEEANAKGGILGRKVELVYYDDQSNPATVPGIYTKLMDVDKVDVLSGGYGTVTTAAAMPTVIQRKRNFFGFVGLDVNKEFKYDRYFTLQPSGPDPQAEFSRGFFELAAAITPKPQSVAIVGADQEFGIIAMNGARAHAKELGFKVVYDSKYPPATIDFTPMVRSIKAANPDLIFIASYPPDTSGMMRAIYEVGIKAQMVGGSLVGVQFAALKQQLGPLLNNVVAYDFYAPEPTMKFAGIDEFLAKYRERAPAAGVDVLGLYLPPLAYAQMQVLEQAINAVGSASDDAKLAEHMHNATFKTIIGDVKFGKYGEWEKARVLTVQYRNISGNDVQQFKEAGKQVIVDPPGLKSGDLVVGFDATKK